MACGLAAAAVAAVVAVASPGPATHPAGSPASTSPKSSQPVRAGSVQQAILTAVGSVSDDILYIRVTSSGIPAGMALPQTQYWLWPARTVPGQHSRSAISRISISNRTNDLGSTH